MLVESSLHPRCRAQPSNSLSQATAITSYEVGTITDGSMRAMGGWGLPEQKSPAQVGEELGLSPGLLTPDPGALTINNYSVHSFSKHFLNTCCAGTLPGWGSLVNWRDPGHSPAETDSPVQGKGNKHLKR